MKTIFQTAFQYTLILGLGFISACGKDSSSSSSNSKDSPEIQQEIAPVDGSNIDGHYQAKFNTLNPHVNGTIPGSANFQRTGDKIYAYVRLFAGGVKAWHMQHVYEGSRCPNMNDDNNGDGFIDIQEAEAVLGKILIPLDSDISSQSSGRRFFPVADLSGYYHYERITNFKRFLSDLQEADNDPNDDLTKLAPGEGLRISGRAVLIQGVAETVELPETVATKGRNSPFQTLPIACGIFSKVSSQAGMAYNEAGEIPGPLADVIEGQDRPGEEPDTNTTGGSTGDSGTSTDTTNESDDGNGPISDGETTSGSTSGRTTSGSSSTSGGSTNGRTTTGGTTTGGTTTGGTTTGGTTTGGTTTGGSTTGGTTTGGSTTGGSTTGGSTTGGSTTGSSTTGS